MSVPRRALALVALALLVASTVPVPPVAAAETVRIRVLDATGGVILHESTFTYDGPTMHRFAVAAEGWNDFGSGEGVVAIDDLVVDHADGSRSARDFATAPTIRESTTGTTYPSLRYDATGQRLLGVSDSRIGCGSNYRSLDLGASAALRATFRATRITGDIGDGSYWEMYVGLIPDDARPFVGTSCSGPTGRPLDLVGAHFYGDGDGFRRHVGGHSDNADAPPILHALFTTYTVEIAFPPYSLTPSAPRDLAAARGPERGEVTLSWNPPAASGGSAIVAYHVYRDGIRIGSVGEGPRVYVDRGLPDGATHTYEVSAANGHGEGPRSAPVTGRAPSAPSVPTNAHANVHLDDLGRVTVRWTASADGGGFPVTYDVYRTRYPAQGAPPQLVGSTAGTTLVQTRVATGDYEYTVRARNAIGTSAPSIGAIAQVTSPWPPPPIGYLASGTGRHGEAQFVWITPPQAADSISGFEIVDVGPDGATTVHAVGKTEFVTLRLLRGGSHAFTVRSVNAHGHGEATAPKTLTLTAPVIVGLGDSVGAGHGLGPSLGYPGNPYAHSQQLAAKVGGTALTYAISGSCAMTKGRSGAHVETNDGCTKSIYEDQLPLLQQFPGGLRPSLVTISAGANDIEFDRCLRYFLSNGLTALNPQNPEGGCSDADLDSSLRAYKANMDRVLQYLRDIYGPNVPVALTQYYDPFPAAGMAACEVWMPTVAVKYGYDTFANDGLYLGALAEVQAEARAETARILGKLNGAIAEKGSKATIVPARDFGGHDLCRGNRDVANGVTDPTQVWVYAPEFYVTAARASVFPDAPAHDRHFIPVPSACDTSAEEPGFVSATVPAPGSLVQIDTRLNCFPHPTREGQEQLALGILDVFAPGRV